jgi:hypothetical protein
LGFLGAAFLIEGGADPRFNTRGEAHTLSAPPAS